MTLIHLFLLLSCNWPVLEVRDIFAKVCFNSQNLNTGIRFACRAITGAAKCPFCLKVCLKEVKKKFLKFLRAQVLLFLVFYHVKLFSNSIISIIDLNIFMRFYCVNTESPLSCSVPSLFAADLIQLFPCHDLFKPRLLPAISVVRIL